MHILNASNIRYKCNSGLYKTFYLFNTFYSKIEFQEASLIIINISNGVSILVSKYIFQDCNSTLSVVFSLNSKTLQQIALKDFLLKKCLLLMDTDENFF